jgi:hypothetical protein
MRNGVQQSLKKRLLSHQADTTAPSEKVARVNGSAFTSPRTPDDVKMASQVRVTHVISGTNVCVADIAAKVVRTTNTCHNHPVRGHHTTAIVGDCTNS